MTKKQKAALMEAVEDLRKIEGKDAEAAHDIADAVILKALEELGFPLIAAEWHKVADRAGGFWYA